MRKDEIADRIRHLVVDTEWKVDGLAQDFGVSCPESPDRQYLLEDLMGRLASLAREIDGRAALFAPEFGKAPAYDLIERRLLGSLTESED